MKAKGSKAEREIVQMLWGSGFAAIRAAGSGVSRFYCPDVLASNGIRTLAIECKSTKYKYQYFEHAQIHQLEEFARIFNAEAWLAVKFSNAWRFFKISDLKKTKKKLTINSKSKNAKFFSDIT